MAIELQQVKEAAGWQAYHAIRRHVLFELRGLDGYDDQHPDEHEARHIPLLLRKDGVALGTVRLDLSDGVTGVVRLVAILPEHQRQGFGRILMSEVEKLSAKHGLCRLEVHAAPDAVPFYEKLGWVMVDTDRSSPLMVKDIQSVRGT
ncbi:MULTISPECIES: GNAT family N-acetyltransferase [unclassified Rhizobium]|jgi:GNAT superfamily N-acetyltransferase|uniref:GNAT family N-acetyltransferase n=1 Tax=unclassified Rhizobium TaxID=2613769 RepID=UPI001C831DC1|nr:MULTISPECIES: GNAT family N-acetyltransferase [unclassified Rhizobium]MBX5160311.1 GNAT family N-acetyltransferase [Rhizobium sp. NZLR8]MBX5165374.1 GNAT family N-acetyltransferase [Rhizobium sp. NZLR4b]MBX5172547.1 GNAT family N-acetyltransferase [Rhizobium sp. NZLR1b]MBX5186705.1 GNAT family N-acetyltransferase [Rhizobium sp. NZLR5]MBX5191025.1 GNAT family N-acetyltransferase [Rhizobium sp. NZLR3b]